MLRSIIVLLSWGVGYFVYAHPHCHYDQREVDVGRDLTFCSMEFAPEGICCTQEEETALEATFNAAGDLTAECADYYKQVMCHRQNFISYLLSNATYLARCCCCCCCFSHSAHWLPARKNCCSREWNLQPLVLPTILQAAVLINVLVHCSP